MGLLDWGDGVVSRNFVFENCSGRGAFVWWVGKKGEDTARIGRESMKEVDVCYLVTMLAKV